MNILPTFIRRRIDHRPNLVRILDNIGWLFIDKILRMTVGLLVGIWLARYLGPQQFGQLNFATAFVSLFGIVATMGLKDIVIRDLVRQPENTNTILGTAFTLRLLGGIAAAFLIIGTIAWLRPDDRLTRVMVAILGFTLIFKSSEVIKYWFEAQVQSRYAVWVENLAFLIIASTKVVMILKEAPLIAFVWAMAAETLLASAGLLTIYIKQRHHLRAWRPQLRTSKALLHDSFPLLISAGMIVVNMNIDKIMLGSMLDDASVGIYSVSTQLYNFIFSIFVITEASIFPKLVKSKDKKKGSLHREIVHVYRILFITSLLALPFLGFAAPPTITLLFGQDYATSASVFLVYMLLMPFALITRGQAAYLKIENLTKMIMWRQFLIMLLNIIFNLILIPIIGIKGAATSIVIAFTAGSVIATIVGPTKTDLLHITTGITGIRRMTGHGH